MDTYFKNTELATLYGVSEGTVRNWVKSSRGGKLKLKLVDFNGHTYVAKDISNIPLIEALVRHNRKYRNTLSSKTVRPSVKLLDVFSKKHIHDLLRNLELHKEVPVQYSYFGPGAMEWNDYIMRQDRVGAPSMYTRTIELLSDNFGYISKRLSGYRKVNVIDVGVGNAMPVKGLLQRLLREGKEVKYVGVDFCSDMLDISLGHLKEWFGESVDLERRELDIAYETFADVTAADYLDDKGAINLVLFLGATPNNLRVREDAFRSICESMGPNDLLLYTDKIEPYNAPPEWYEHGAKYGRSEVMSLLRLVYDLFGIDEALYDVEVGFDEVMEQRYARTRFKVDLQVDFDLPGIKKSLSFRKGEAVTLWRCWQTTPKGLTNLLESTGFYVLHTSQSEDHNYILTIAEVKRS